MSEEKGEKFYDQLDRLGTDLSINHGKRVYLEEMRKSLKAELMLEFEQNSKCKITVDQKENYAYSHQKYRKLLEDLREATELETACRRKIKVMELKFEGRKIQAMREMAEMKMR